MTGSHSVHQISGLFPFLWLCYHGIPAVLIFSTPIYLTETGTILLICFCYYYEFIITITLSIWSDKRCCKKVRWKNKKIRLAVFFLQSKLLFFYIKKTTTTYLTPHRLKLHTIFFGVNFEPRIFKFFFRMKSKKPNQITNHLLFS